MDLRDLCGDDFAIMQADPLRRSVYYYKGHPRDYAVLRRRLRELAGTRVRYGYRRLMVLLRR